LWEGERGEWSEGEVFLWRLEVWEMRVSECTPRSPLLCFVFCQERDIGDEYGWKQVHGDVFRTPPYPILFTALIGTGYQLATVALGCIIIELTGHLYMQ
jgi:hypothetical protein